jgi:hypothetical protein
MKKYRRFKGSNEMKENRFANGKINRVGYLIWEWHKTIERCEKEILKKTNKIQKCKRNIVRFKQVLSQIKWRFRNKRQLLNYCQK